MRLSTIDMRRIYDHQPEYIRFFGISKDHMPDEEWNNYIALPMLVKKIFVKGSAEAIREAKLQFPLKIQESKDSYMGERNKLSVELDITSKCNMSCPNCVRFSQFKETWVDLDMDQIERFIMYNKIYGKRLTVKVIGGEPLVHTNFFAILNRLNEHFHIMVATNGLIEWTPPFPMTIEDSAKEKGVHPEFYATQDAPKDDPEYDGEDYQFGCSIANTCGAVFTVDGYYPCTTAGSIDRMLRRPGGPRESMVSLAKPDLSSAIKIDNRKKVFQSLCQYCGVYKKLGFHEADNTRDSRVTEQVFSKSWEFMKDTK